MCVTVPSCALTLLKLDETNLTCMPLKHTLETLVVSWSLFALEFSLISWNSFGTLETLDFETRLIWLAGQTGHNLPDLAVSGKLKHLHSSLRSIWWPLIPTWKKHCMHLHHLEWQKVRWTLLNIANKCTNVSNLVSLTPIAPCCNKRNDNDDMNLALQFDLELKFFDLNCCSCGAPPSCCAKRSVSLAMHGDVCHLQRLVCKSVMCKTGEIKRSHKPFPKQAKDGHHHQGWHTIWKLPEHACRCLLDINWHAWDHKTTAGTCQLAGLECGVEVIKGPQDSERTTLHEGLDNVMRNKDRVNQGTPTNHEGKVYNNGDRQFIRPRSINYWRDLRHAAEAYTKHSSQRGSQKKDASRGGALSRAPPQHWNCPLNVRLFANE